MANVNDGIGRKGEGGREEIPPLPPPSPPPSRRKTSFLHSLIRGGGKRGGKERACLPGAVWVRSQSRPDIRVMILMGGRVSQTHSKEEEEEGVDRGEWK